MLNGTPPGFVLYGGTALALRLGHRESVDFDFFSRETFDPARLHEEVPYLQGSMAIQSNANTLTCVLDLGGQVMVSFFGGLSMHSVQAPDKAEGPGILVASLLDIAATKAVAVQQRASSKDYVDIDAILQSGLPLRDILGAAKAVSGSRFNPVLTLKALSYFEEDDLGKVPQSTRDNLCEAVKLVDLDDVPEFKAYASLCPAEAEDDIRHDF